MLDRLLNFVRRDLNIYRLVFAHDRTALIQLRACLATFVATIGVGSLAHSSWCLAGALAALATGAWIGARSIKRVLPAVHNVEVDGLWDAASALNRLRQEKLGTLLADRGSYDPAVLAELVQAAEKHAAGRRWSDIAASGSIGVLYVTVWTGFVAALYALAKTPGDVIDATRLAFWLATLIAGLIVLGRLYAAQVLDWRSKEYKELARRLDDLRLDALIEKRKHTALSAGDGEPVEDGTIELVPPADVASANGGVNP